MEVERDNTDRRVLLDAMLTELSLYAKELCPEATVEASTTRYEDEDGHVDVFPPPTLSESEEDRVELALAERSSQRPGSTCSAWCWTLWCGRRLEFGYTPLKPPARRRA